MHHSAQLWAIQVVLVVVVVVVVVVHVQQEGRQRHALPNQMPYQKKRREHDGQKHVLVGAELQGNVATMSKKSQSPRPQRDRPQVKTEHVWAKCLSNTHGEVDQVEIP